MTIWSQQQGTKWELKWPTKPRMPCRRNKLRRIQRRSSTDLRHESAADTRLIPPKYEEKQINEWLLSQRSPSGEWGISCWSQLQRSSSSQHDEAEGNRKEQFSSRTLQVVNHLSGNEQFECSLMESPNRTGRWNIYLIIQSTCDIFMS